MSANKRGTRAKVKNVESIPKDTTLEEEKVCNDEVCVAPTAKKPESSKKGKSKSTLPPVEEAGEEIQKTEPIVQEADAEIEKQSSPKKIESSKVKSKKTLPSVEEQEPETAIEKIVSGTTTVEESLNQVDLEEEPEEEKESPIYFELFTEEGKAMKVLFDIAFWLMPTDLYLIWTPGGLLYSNSNKDGCLIMQFQLYADKLGKFKVPWNLKAADDATIISISSKDMLNNTKGCIKNTSLSMYVKKQDIRSLNMEIGSKGSSPTFTQARIGGGNGYRPVDVPMYPEGLRASIKVNGKEFQDKWKTFTTYNTETEIIVQKSALMAKAGRADSNRCAIPFGIWDPKAPELFKGTFSSTMLSHIAKAGSISSQIAIYVVPNKPLKIVADVSSFGTIFFHLYAAKSQ